MINVLVGNCGNQIGYQFYETLAREHSILPDGQKDTKKTTNQEDYEDRPCTFFHEHDHPHGTSNQSTWSPRAVLVDMEPTSIHNILNKELYGKMFRSENVVYHNQGAGGNWAKGHYVIGVELVDNVLDIVRKQVEDCDNFHGVQLFHSLGGGSGSGWGTLIVSKLREEFPDKMMSTCSVFPSPKMSDCVVEPYNCILSMHQLVENADFVSCFDNEALFDIQFRLLNNPSPGYKEINQMVAKVMSDVTCSFRFATHLGYNLRKLTTNIVPFPRLHFALISHAPLYGSSLNVSQLFQQMLDGKHAMSSCDPRLGHYLTSVATFRGSMTMREVEDESLSISNSSNWAEWIPSNLKLNVCKKTLNGEEINSATMIGNSTSIQYMFKRIEEQFDMMFKKKAFLRSMCYEGMDEMEFTEAQHNVRDLIEEYQQYQDI